MNFRFPLLRKILNTSLTSINVYTCNLSEYACILNRKNAQQNRAFAIHRCWRLNCVRIGNVGFSCADGGHVCTYPRCRFHSDVFVWLLNRRLNMTNTSVLYYIIVSTIGCVNINHLTANVALKYNNNT